MKKLIYLFCLGLIGFNIGNSYAIGDVEKDEYRYELEISNEGISDDVGVVSEGKSYDYETAKTITDMNGYTVRMEQYLSRPAADQLKVEVYNSRDNGITTGYRLDTYSKELPVELSSLLRQTGKPAWFITDRQTHVANDTGDYYDHSLTGGWLYLHALPDTYDVLYNKEETKVSGVEKIKIEREESDPAGNVPGILAYWFPNKSGVLEKAFDGKLQDINWAILPTYEHHPTLTEIVEKVRAGNPIDLRESTKLTFADGTWLANEQAWIDDDGNILNTDTLKSARQEINSGTDWRDIVSKWNSEHVFTASEFSTRKIDIIWSPQSFLAQVTENMD